MGGVQGAAGWLGSAILDGVPGEILESLPGPAVSSGEAGGPRLSLIAVQGTGWEGKASASSTMCISSLGLALQPCLGWDWHKASTQESGYFLILSGNERASSLLEALGKTARLAAVLREKFKKEKSLVCGK